MYDNKVYVISGKNLQKIINLLQDLKEVAAEYADMVGEDVDDVYIWQCYGTTDWEVPKYNIKNTLLPGQMIFIRAGVEHRAIITGPRISVSFSIGT